MSKIIEIFKRFFSKAKVDKTKMIEDKNTDKNQRDSFVKTISNNNDAELIDLQRKLEHNQISVNDLNIFNVMDLIDRYELQVVELKGRVQNS